MEAQPITDAYFAISIFRVAVNLPAVTESRVDSVDNV